MKLQIQQLPEPFPFGLSEQQEARAARLHADAIVFDWLSQHVGGPNLFDAYPSELRAEFDAMMLEAGVGLAAMVKAMYWPYQMSLAGRSHLVADWYRQSGMTCGTYGIMVHDGNNPVAHAWQAQTDALARLPWMRYVTKAEEIRQAKRDGVIAFYAHFQPTSPIPRDLKTIDEAFGRGLRSLMLTYNRMDHVGVGCTERVDAGLSMYGVEVVRHCNELGLIVDTSHCGHLTTIDACKHSKAPVNANHTCAKAVNNSARAKSDEALRAIADTGGVIGVVAVPFFLSKQRRAGIDVMLDHIDHIANLVGWQHVSLGTDWPMQAPEDTLRATLSSEVAQLGFRPEDRIDVADRLNGFDDYRELPNVTRGLVARGWSDEQIVGILGGNAMRVFEQVCG